MYTRRPIPKLQAPLLLVLALLLFPHPAQATQTAQEAVTPIAEIQSQFSRGDDSAFVGKTVTIQGVVTGVYGDLFFVQEPVSEPWSGIAVYQPGHDVAVGDAVTVTGPVAEFHDLTEIEPERIQVRSSNNPLPEPVLLPVQQAKGERWEGVLVRVENVIVIDAPDRFGEWRIRDESGIIRVDDKGVFYAAQEGEMIPSITAIVDHAFGTFRLIPRTLDDIGGRAPGPVPLPEDITPIYAVQGDGPRTPLERSRINTYGIVVAAEENGFYLQDPAGDGNPATSDGIYVYTEFRPQVTVGQCVLVRSGAVSEYYDKTELSRAKQITPVDLCGDAAIAPVSVPLAEPNVDPAALLERYEGMLVAVDKLQGVVQGPTKRFRNGNVEIALIADRSLPYITGGRVFQARPEDVEGLIYLSNVLGAELPEAAWGDAIRVEPAAEGEPVLAVLDYNFGKYQLMLLPSQNVVVEARRAVQDEADAPGEDEFTVCTFNVLGLGRGGEQYREEAAYGRELRKRARAIAQGLQGCTIIGIQETGKPEDAENLAAVLRDEFGLDYASVARKGPGSRSLEFPLTNSLLARTDRAHIVKAELVQGCSPYSYGVGYMVGACPRGQYGLFNRPPLVVDLEVSGAWGEPYPLTVIVNHWKSKGGDESVNVVRRTLQAEHVASLVQERLDADPDAHVVVLGDLNDYYASGPVLALQKGTTPPLIHTYDLLPELDRYTYIFNGASQVLDHILITPGLRPAFAGVDPLHINADFPVYAQTDPTTVFRSSDHDPVQMTIRPGGAGWVGGDVQAPGVGVLLQDETGAAVAATTSDARGDFRLFGIAPGAYTLRLLPPEGVHIDTPERSVQVTAGAGLYFDVPVEERLTDRGSAAALFGAGVGVVAEP